MTDRNPQVFNTSNKTSSQTQYDAKGDILVGSTVDKAGLLQVGSNDQVLVANSSATLGVNWSATLAGLTLTTPVISQISNTGTLTLPTSTDTIVGRATTDTLSNKTLTSPVVTTIDLTGGVVDRLQEDWNVVASAAPSTVNFYVNTASLWYYTSSTTASFALNVKGDVSTNLDTIVGNGDSMTIVLMVNCANTAHYATALSIDGTAQTVRWLGGTAPTAGSGSGALDVYTFLILRTNAVTPATYTVLGSFSRYG